MATAVLPHNIDFVPLDVLTAAELNMMRANENYLATFANGLATGANLDDESILPRHIALAMLSRTETSTTGTVLSTTASNILTLDISDFPNGAAMDVTGVVGAGVAADGVVGTIIRIFYNSVAYAAVSQTNSWGRSVATGAKITKVAGQNSIALQGYKDNATVGGTMTAAYKYLSARLTT